MAIKSIEIKNFKSFNELDLELRDLNILIGANASGKSNFIKIFQFLRDIVSLGLDNAISMQGGFEYLKNINLKTSHEFSVKFLLDFKKYKTGFSKILTDENIEVRLFEVSYEFTLNFGKTDYEIMKDKLIYSYEFTALHGREEECIKSSDTGEVIIFREDKKLKVSFNKPESLKDRDIFLSLLPVYSEKDLPSDSLLLESNCFYSPFDIRKQLCSLSIYDIDPSLSRKAIPLSGRLELEEDGSNLAIILKNILSHKEKRRKFINLTKDLLPFVNDIKIEKFADKYLIFTLKEKYSKDNYLPASLISDGTINITALIIALYFETDFLTIIEEPERYMHPSLIAGIIDMMKDVSHSKQIILTTHNPEIVKHGDIDNIFLVGRDKEGFSQIIRPADKEEIKVFLDNELGLEELFVQNLLRL